MDSVVIVYNDDVHSDNGKIGYQSKMCRLPHTT
ncbi:hypothetical protein [Campylobacter concisus]|nr:hypothetical protein [Campylobacter concisus]